MSDGLIGFLVILGLALGAFFLFRSMVTHLRRVPPSFDQPTDPTETTETTEPGQSSGRD